VSLGTGTLWMWFGYSCLFLFTGYKNRYFSELRTVLYARYSIETGPLKPLVVKLRN